jgi:ATP-dependent DNA helicase RecG
MKQSELIEIVGNGESSKVEFKVDEVHPGALAEEVVAFANLDGGMILFGVDESGEISGCTRSGMEEFIVNVCRNNVRPSILPVIEKVVLKDKIVYIATIPRGDTVHTTNKGRYLIRVGSTKQTPTQQELLRLFQRKGVLQFDETPVLNASLNSIDIQKVNRYLARLEQSPIEDESEKTLEHELRNLSILAGADDRILPTLGGMLAFGKNPQKHFPSYNILCGAYRGEDFLSDTIREKELFAPWMK